MCALACRRGWAVLKTLNSKLRIAALWVLVEDDGAWAPVGVALYIVSVYMYICIC